MDNQHKLITGYRDLSQDEITRINEWKEIEHHLSRMLNAAVINGTAQARWNAMARSYLEIGCYYAIKAIAWPRGGLGDPDEAAGRRDFAEALGDSDGSQVADEEAAERRYTEAYERNKAQIEAYHVGAPLGGLTAEQHAAQQEAKHAAKAAALERTIDHDLTRDGRPKLTTDEIEADRDQHGFDPFVRPTPLDIVDDRPGPAIDPGDLLPDVEPAPGASIRSELFKVPMPPDPPEPRRPGAPNATFGSRGAQFVPTPDNPDDVPGQITSDRQTELHPKSDRDLP